MVGGRFSIFTSPRKHSMVTNKLLRKAAKVCQYTMTGRRAWRKYDQLLTSIDFQKDRYSEGVYINMGVAILALAEKIPPVAGEYDCLWRAEDSECNEPDDKEVIWEFAYRGLARISEEQVVEACIKQMSYLTALCEDNRVFASRMIEHAAGKPFLALVSTSVVAWAQQIVHKK